jgi:hypothetical protein
LEMFGRSIFCIEVVCEHKWYNIDMKNNILAYPILLLLSCFVYSNEETKIVVINYHYRSSKEDLKRLGIPANINTATIIENEKKVDKIQKTLEMNSKKPAHVCGYDWLFIIFKDKYVINQYSINSNCIDDDVNKVLSSYYPIKSKNATVYTIEVSPEIPEEEIINNISDEVGIVFSLDEQYSKYPMLTIKYEIFDKARRRKILHRSIDELKRMIPGIVYLKEGGAFGRGVIKVVLPLDFDSSIVNKISLDTCFTLSYSHPNSYRLYLVSKITDKDVVKEKIKLRGIKSIF